MVQIVRIFIQDYYHEWSHLYEQFKNDYIIQSDKKVDIKLNPPNLRNEYPILLLL